MDREKVIKGLECCSVPEGHCGQCPYETDGYVAECTSALAGDALALLKELDEEIENLKQTCQSMMEGVCLLKEQGKLKSSPPTLIKNDKDQNEYWLICGFCKHKIDALFRFCPYCGREIELT